MIRTDALFDLPVHTVVPELLEALGAHGAAVLEAPPGTGKTTLVPLALAGLVPALAPGGAPETRRVLVAEPRRMAARAAARRMAWLLGEEVGGRVGFTVRGERRAGRETVVEVVTTGVLLQRLQRDPELPGADAVLLDECHERHLDADTAAAFLLDVRSALRPGLWLLAASATTDAAAWSRLLGDPEGGGGAAPVVRAEGRAHPVTVHYVPPPRPVRPPHGTRVDPALLEHVAATVRTALREADGDVLCFLPGVGEIARVAGMLGGLDAEVLQLHGQAPAAVQEAVLRGSGARRRVVLTTSVAESSLTVPGVRTVVDSGLAREPRMDHGRGLGALTTVRVSAASAAQRAGRAGREAPGRAYRCWAEAEDARLPRSPSPEIAVADLAPFALHAACWGDPDASSLALPDPPPAGAMAVAREVLTAVGAVDERGRPTERGVRMARLGLHPRLARALLDGAREVGARRAAELVALLSEEPPRGLGDDLAAVWRAVRGSGARGDGGGRQDGVGRGGRDGQGAYAARWRREVRRLESAVSGDGRAVADRGATGPAARAAGDGAGAGGAGGTGGGGDTGGAGAGDRGGAGAGDRGGAGGSGGGSGTGETGGAGDSGPANDSGGAGGRGRAGGAGGGGGDAGGGAGGSGSGGAGGGGSGGGGGGAGGRGSGSGGAGGRGSGSGGAGGRGGGSGRGVLSDDGAAGLVAALAFPERVARRRGTGAYLMASGTGAELGDGSRLGAAEWLAVAVADRPVAAASARVRLAAVIDGESARWAASPLYAAGEEVAWSAERGDVVARRVERLGALELAVRPLSSPDRTAVRAALLDGLRREGLGLLRWSREAEQLRDRMAFLHRELGEPWPDVSDPALLAPGRVEEWLGPALERARRRADLERVDAGRALAHLLPWATGEAARFDELAPERIAVPSGSRVRIDYGGPQPVLAVKLQELFGRQETPRIADGRVPLLVHLLSPAGRPAAVTADLASFWREGYRSVRAELRGRYPKHPWPEDPATAEPTRRTNTRR
ncbi:ATP-dependent RNA helicase [Streptomyces albus]|uniref:ATP-dependent RNA helicase n=1 Tax=Streptomyces albus TaxID=1888 RepID=UPI00055C2B75|nr:ATP-dependent helicase C-terminal domain-containing protein [Streptomyces albus]